MVIIFMSVSPRRGISPVVATVLIILIAISAGIVLYAFTQGFVGNPSRSASASSAVLVVESASCSGSSLILYVANRGHGEG